MSAKKKTPDIDPEKLEIYDQLIESYPDIERKGAMNPYTSLNGHMFSFLDKTGTMSLRLPKDELEAFLTEHSTERSVQYNTVMKEYALIPDELFRDREKMHHYLDRSLAYIRSLKPKPTKSKKK